MDILQNNLQDTSGLHSEGYLSSRQEFAKHLWQSKKAQARLPDRLRCCTHQKNRQWNDEEKAMPVSERHVLLNLYLD